MHHVSQSDQAVAITEESLSRINRALKSLTQEAVEAYFERYSTSSVAAAGQIAKAADILERIIKNHGSDGN